MSVTVEAFRAAFPEFADVPDAAVAGALETASLLWNPGRLGKFWERIVMLSVAHRLAVRFNIGRALNAAGMKGAEAGVVNSQSASTSSLSVTNANNGMVTGTEIRFRRTTRAPATVWNCCPCSNSSCRTAMW